MDSKIQEGGTFPSETVLTSDSLFTPSLVERAVLDNMLREGRTS